MQTFIKWAVVIVFAVLALRSIVGFEFVEFVIFGAIALVGLLIPMGRTNGEKTKTNRFIPAGFDATYSHDFIAINERDRTVWVKEGRGPLDSKVLNAGDIRSVTLSQDVWYYIELSTRDLDKPIWRIGFMSNVSRQKNRAQAEEWYARLNAFLDFRHV